MFYNAGGTYTRHRVLVLVKHGALGPRVSPLLTSFLCPDVEQMAVDWLTGNFYFVDDVDDRIFVCDINGQTCVTLLDQELYNPKGIALDPTVGSVLCLSLSHTYTSLFYFKPIHQRLIPS